MASEKSSVRSKTDIVSGANPRPSRSSVVGGLLRRLADFFDRLSLPSLGAGSTREVEFIALGLLFTGIVTLAVLIHGWFFLPWIFIFTVYFTGWTWIIFRSASWPLNARSILLSFLLILSIPAGIERVFAMAAFIALAAVLLWQAIRPLSDFIRKEKVSVIAVMLLCFSAYDGFARIVEWRRTAALKIPGGLSLDCQVRPGGGSTCGALDAVFEVPEFWHQSTGSSLIRDLQNVGNLKTYADSATDNKIAFGVFTFNAEKLMIQMNNYFGAQKSFLRAKSSTGDPLSLNALLRSADAELYSLQYESDAKPGYTGERVASNALFLFHQQRGTTWLFIIDGTDLSGREFLLHRIISGFR